MPGTLSSVIEVENRRDVDPVVGFTNRYRHKDGHYLTLEWRAQRQTASTAWRATSPTG
jgi:hypothetical protein